MKKIKIMSLLVLFLSVVMACNTKNKEDQHNHKAGEETLFYTCSMDPQIKEDKPGKCPICQMDLTPMKQDKSEANELKLSNQQIKLGNITTQAIAETKNSIDQNYTGVLTVNQEKTNTVASRAMGRIEKLYFKTLGEYVPKNAPVYSLYSEDLAIAKQDYYTAYKQLDMPGDFGKNAKNLLQVAKQKLLYFGLTNSQIESIKTSKDISPNTTFYSSQSGTITEIIATEGSYVMEGSGIVKQANLNNLWLETQVNISYAKNLKTGQNASVTFADFPNKTTNAKVSFINPEINPHTRLLLIRMEIQNPNLELKPGMQARVKLTQSNIKGVYIPTDAVIREEKATYIWVEKSPGIFENKMVETGIESNGLIEIKTALDPTKKVVITGAYAINSEYKFRKGSDPMEGMKM